MINTAIYPVDPQSLQAAARLLSAGQIVAIPTETVYGLAGHALNEQALARIFAVKARPHFDPLIVHLAQQRARSLAELEAAELIQTAELSLPLQKALDRLIQAFWPGPLTLVLPRHARIPELVTAGLPTVALRVPAHPAAQALLAQSFPLAAPSANRFGRISPTTAAAVYAELQGRIPLILDGGPCEIGLESTVLGLESEQLVLLRPGQLSQAQLSQVAGLPVSLAQSHPAEVKAPGMLKSHYAPERSLQLFHAPSDLTAHMRSGQRAGVLFLSPPPAETQALLAAHQAQWLALSATGDLSEVAHHLFARLRELDSLDVDYLLAEQPAEAQSGLGFAILDRLSKAAARKT